jgi:ATP-binding cassette, subfamily B, multidrug efflux pump
VFPLQLSPAVRLSSGQSGMQKLTTLIPYFRPYKTLLGVTATCVLISVLIGLAIPIVLRHAVDGLINNISWRGLTRNALLIMGVTCLSSLFYLLSRHFSNLFGQQLSGDLREKLYAHLQKQSFYFFQENAIGDLLSRTTTEVERLRMSVGQVLVTTLQLIFTIIFIIPLMLRVNPRLTIVLVIVLPLIFLLVHYCNAHAKSRNKQTQDCFIEMLKRTEDGLKGLRVVRAYSQEKFELRSFAGMSRDHRNRMIKLSRTNSLIAPLLQLLLGISIVANTWYGGVLTARGQITVGQFIEFNTYMMRLIWPLGTFGQIIRFYHLISMALGRAHEILQSKPVIVEPETTRPLRPIKGKIEFRDLTFAYREGGRPVLKDISLTIQAGQTVGLIGRTGAGKSTLMNLIPRLLEAPTGTVFIDDVSVRDYALTDLRRNISYITQETLLFSDSLAANIAFGVERAERGEIEWAAEGAGLSPDVHSFPDGFETHVGERGVTLSGGQKQRTAIARALLGNPKILLFDDALSAVDIPTREKIAHWLRHEMRGRTCLIVAHFTSTVRHADLICVLENGRIVEVGTHDELRRRGRAYAELYERECLQEELATN